MLVYELVWNIAASARRLWQTRFEIPDSLSFCCGVDVLKHGHGFNDIKRVALTENHFFSGYKQIPVGGSSSPEVSNTRPEYLHVN